MADKNMPTSDEFREAFREVRKLRIGLYEAAEAEKVARQALQKAKAGHVLSGLEGSNQAQRDAYLESLIERERGELDAADLGTREAQLDLELAEIELNSLKWQMRAVVAYIELSEAA